MQNSPDGPITLAAFDEDPAGELEHELAEIPCFQGLIGQSPKMLEVFDRIRQIAPHFRTVLLSGDTGTGKELAARALHDLSPAGVGPFVACNCSAVVETLFESELFGYAKGAFTGALQDKQGLLEYAHGGTLLLDEIGDMPLGVQSKLLRVLQNQEIQRVGSPVPRKVNLRVVAASNRDLRVMVGAREFRKDLFYRLSMVEIRLPRLSERKGDLQLLERYFLARFSDEFKKPILGRTARAQALLAAYPWPGNVRELENVLGHAFDDFGRDDRYRRRSPSSAGTRRCPGAGAREDSAVGRVRALVCPAGPALIRRKQGADRRGAQNQPVETV